MTLRVAVVGLGWAAKTIWLPRLEAHPDIAVTAVVDPDPAARAAYQAAAGPVRVLSSPDELTRHSADLVIVAVPNHAHSPVACALLRRGIPVFLEKPVCLSLAEARDLAAAEHEGGAVLLAGSASRYRGDILALQKAAATLGGIRHLRLDWVRSHGVPGTAWFTQRGAAGGGALVDLGWHLLDMALPLLGPVGFPEIVGTVGHDFVNRGQSQAAWREDGAAWPAARAGDVEDTARAFLVTDRGTSVALHACWASHARHDTTVVEVHGTAGTAELRCTFGFSPNRPGASALTVARDGELAVVPLAHEEIGTEYDRQVAALGMLLADPDQRGKAVRSARTTIGVIERIYASASGRYGPAPEREPAWALN